MDKFMLIFHNTPDLASMKPSPEEIQVEMQRWNEWIGGIASQGKMLGTEALMPFGKLLKGKDQPTITDGPYSEGKEVIGGYMLIQADNLEEAVAIAHGCPSLAQLGTVEVRQVVDFTKFTA